MKRGINGAVYYKNGQEGQAEFYGELRSPPDPFS
jgi:hypothetical protein